MFLVILQRFRVYLLETNRVLDFVVILLYFSLEHKLDSSKKRCVITLLIRSVFLKVLTKYHDCFFWPICHQLAHAGLVRMCACMLQTLSKDRAFGRTLNRPFDGHASLPANVRIHNFHGTYGDYLICVCEQHKTCLQLLHRQCSTYFYPNTAHTPTHSQVCILFDLFAIRHIVHSTSDCDNKEDAAIALPGFDFDALECITLHPKHITTGIKSSFAVDDLICFSVVSSR